jgi:hypothetical protein
MEAPREGQGRAKSLKKTKGILNQALASRKSLRTSFMARTRFGRVKIAEKEPVFRFGAEKKAKAL